MNGKIGAMVAIFMMVGMAVGFGGWDDSKSYADNVKNIFSTNVINFSDGPHSPELNWSDGDKPVRAVDGTPFGYVAEQDVVARKNAVFLGMNGSDPYAENLSLSKPAHAIDKSWDGVVTEEDAVNKKIAEFMG